MTELNTSEPKPKRRSPDISPERRVEIEIKRQATRDATWIKKGCPPRKTPNEPRIIDKKAIIGRPRKEPSSLIKGGSAESESYRCHYAADHPTLTHDDLNKVPQYALNGRTFGPLQLALAQEYKQKNHGSELTTLTNYRDKDFDLVTVKDSDGKKISSRYILRPEAEKYICGYLVSTPNKKGDETPMYNTMYLVK